MAGFAWAGSATTAMGHWPMRQPRLKTEELKDRNRPFLDDYSYREGRTWVMARPDAKRMPRGVCLRRREAAPRDVQAFYEALEKGNRSSTN
jgi:hypothetical protein